jgi:hypothetical protein
MVTPKQKQHPDARAASAAPARVAKSNTERSYRRRGILRACGIPVKEKGPIEHVLRAHGVSESQIKDLMAGGGGNGSSAVAPVAPRAVAPVAPGASRAVAPVAPVAVAPRAVAPQSPAKSRGETADRNETRVTKSGGTRKAPAIRSVAQTAAPPKTRKGRKARPGDQEIARLIADELSAMGMRSSEPKALATAIARIRPKLSELEQKRTDAALAKVFQRYAPQQKIDGWMTCLRQYFHKSPDETRELIDALISVAEASGGQDYIDGLIGTAVSGKANASRPRAWDWLWFHFHKMKQQPGFRWEARPRKPGSTQFDIVKAALGDVPRHYREIAKTAGLGAKQVRNRLAVLHRAQCAFPHGDGLWARTTRNTPKLAISDRIWAALNNGREAHYTELARELHERKTSIASWLSRMKNGVKGMRVVKTRDGKWTRWSPEG